MERGNLVPGKTGGRPTALTTVLWALSPWTSLVCPFLLRNLWHSPPALAWRSFIFSSSSGFYSAPSASLLAPCGVVSSRPSFLRRLSPRKSAFTREINYSRQRKGGRAASTWLRNNWDQRFCSEGVVAARSEREGVGLDLSTAACWRGPGASTPWPGVELPTAWSSVSAGNGWLSLPQPEDPSRTLPPRPAKTSGCAEIAWKNLPLISESERQTRAGEGAWMALIRSGLPRAWPSWKSPGLGGVGNGFLASQPNCSTFWTVSLRRSRSRPELGSFLEQGEASRAHRHDSQPHSSPD